MICSGTHNNKSYHEKMSELNTFLGIFKIIIMGLVTLGGSALI